MRFNELFNELMLEAEVTEHDPLFKQALEILKDLKTKSPNAYAKLMARLNDIGSHIPATKSYKLPKDPEDASWVVSMNK